MRVVFVGHFIHFPFEVTANCLGQHPETIIALVGFLLEEHVVNEEAGSDESCLAADIKIHGEGDPEVVHIGECFLDETCPLLGDPAHLVLAIRSQHLELDIATEGEGAHGAFDD